MPAFNVPIVYLGGEDGWGRDPNMGFTPIGTNENGSGGGYQNLYYSSPEEVGYWSAKVIQPNENGTGGGIEPVWHGSTQDFSGLTGGRNGPGSVGSLVGDSGTATFEDANGLRFTYDYANDSFQGLDPQTAKSYLANNPDAYYNILGNQLKNDIVSNWSMARDPANSDLYKKLESLKDISPKAYYEAQLGVLGSKMGWNAGQNTSDRNAEYEKAIQELAPQAIQAGVNPDQFNNILNTTYQNSARSNQQLIANRAQSGGAFIKPNDWVTIGSILGGGALAAYLAPAEAALAGAGSLGSEAAPLTTSEILGSTFGGSNFAIDPLATYGAGLATEGASGFGLNAANPSGIGLNAGSPSGIMATESAAGLGGPGTGIIEGLVPSSVGMEGTYGAGSLAGIAGTESAAGLGGSALGTGLTADQLALYESQNPTSLQDVGKTLNQARQVNSAANNLAKLLSGGSTGSTTASNTAASGSNLGALLSALRPQTQTNSYLGQYKMNQNPFTFTPQGQTVASEGMYDVSGSNMANALRKA